MVKMEAVAEIEAEEGTSPNGGRKVTILLRVGVEGRYWRKIFWVQQASDTDYDPT